MPTEVRVNNFFLLNPIFDYRRVMMDAYISLYITISNDTVIPVSTCPCMFLLHNLLMKMVSDFSTVSTTSTTIGARNGFRRICPENLKNSQYPKVKRMFKIKK